MMLCEQNTYKEIDKKCTSKATSSFFFFLNLIFKIKLEVHTQNPDIFSLQLFHIFSDKNIQGLLLL